MWSGMASYEKPVDASGRVQLVGSERSSCWTARSAGFMVRAFFMSFTIGRQSMPLLESAIMGS